MISIGWNIGWKKITKQKLTPELLLQAYCSGVFPMSESVDDPEIFWVDPERRGIIPLNNFHVSRSLKKRLTVGKYRFSVDECFDRVVEACANRETTWINPEIRSAYGQLKTIGFAHSIEVWDEKTLIGGLYGVSIAGAFFGESMFSNAVDGSKLAMLALVARLKVGGFTLLDTQFLTDHLATLGGVEIDRDDYHQKLSDALEVEADFRKLPRETSAQELWQLSTQTS